MYTIKRTEEFANWLVGIKDGLTRRRLATRLRKASLGNLGDIKPVGKGVFEMREHFGVGWRMYYIQRDADRDAGRRRQVHAVRRYCQGHQAGRNH